MINIGKIINKKYKIIKQLDQGGMAQVWLAEEINFRNRQVAIKAPRPSLSDAENNILHERFKREVDVCAELAIANTPNVVQALTHEVDGENGFLVMEYMPGGDLEKRIREHPHGMPIEDVIKIAKEILIALDAIHNHPQGIIHRDIKPSNILFNAKGEACLGDFGLAQMSKTSGLLSDVLSGQVMVFTPRYRAPELDNPNVYINVAADIFSFGCVAWEMLTGKIYKDQKPGTLSSQMISNIPDWLDEMVLKCLQDNYWDRWQNAIEILNDNQNFSTNTMILQSSKNNIEPTIHVKENIEKISSKIQPDEILNDQNNKILNKEPTITNNNELIKKSLKSKGNNLTKQQNENVFNMKGFTINDNKQLEHFVKSNRKSINEVFGVYINFGHSGSINSKLSQLKGMDNIKRLSLHGNYHLNKNGLKNIQGLINLEFLDLFCCFDLTDESLYYLRGLVNLKELILTGNMNISDNGLAHLSNLSNLKVLDISQLDKITDSGLVNIGIMDNLTHLYLCPNYQISGSGLTHLKNLSNLSFLAIGGEGLNDSGISHLKQMKNLLKLLISSKKISASSLSNLKYLYKLTHLDLSGVSRMSDSGLAHLKGLTNLTHLHLGSTQISNAGLVHLKGLTNLTHLDLGSTQISNAGLVHLKELANLTYLNLADCNQISDAGLVHLKRLANLIYLNFKSTQFSDAAIIKLKATLTGLNENWDQHDNNFWNSADQ